MAGPRNATTDRSGSRYYSWRGENYYSVTTMIGGGLPKPALINWAKKFVANYAIEHLDTLTTLVADDPEGALEWLKNSPWRDRDKKAELGTDIHEAVEAYILGKPFPPWRPEVKPRMEQFVRFLEDYKPVYEMTEASVYNRTHRYAGTLDAIVSLPGSNMYDVTGMAAPEPEYIEGIPKKFILDMKSGKAVYEDVALQLAMYRYAEFVGLPDGSEQKMPLVDGAAALHLTDHDYTLVDVQADEEVFRFALHVREVYRWKTDVEKHVLRGPLRLGVSPVGPQLTMEQTP